MTVKPRKPWRVILTQNGVQLAEIDHTSENKAYQHVRTALGAGADTARVEQWKDGLWRWYETVTADEIRAAHATDTTGPTP